ncbi:YceK/YidQ family lipoprotein [Leptospira mayottensis]|nr:YceK/YidQ family lipoprotein [Leptospira mayottensis]AZQ02907.1 YceK/YidQ family lipoprotein [Leptospira mayottensis 200901116]TGM95682.1 YceK/YidQ family lipoprotein [Leptospira mayottensis]
MLIFIDLPFTLVFDTILLPVTFPYYLYMESGAPGSEEWYYKKWKKRFYTFIAKNSSRDILSLALKDRSGGYRTGLLRSISYLERNIRNLQKEGITLSKDLEYLMSISSNGQMDPDLQLKQHVEIVGIIYEQSRDKATYEETLWEGYFEIVWRNYFYQGVLVRNPDFLKKILHEFSDGKDAEILFKEFATFYSDSEKHYSLAGRLIYDNLMSKFSSESFKARSDLGLPKTNQEFWKYQIQILLEFDGMIRKDFPHLKKNLNPLWTEAISSGVVSYYRPALEKAFQEFPKETNASIGNLFKKAIDSDNPDSVQFVGRHISDLSVSFASDRDVLLTVLRSPKILEKLLQAGLDPNRSYRSKENVWVINGRWSEGIEEESFLILCLKDDMEASINSLQLLLKYGAKTDLAVKQYSRGREYLYDPNVASKYYSSDDSLYSRKRKILAERVKKQPLNTRASPGM